MSVSPYERRLVLLFPLYLQFYAEFKLEQTFPDVTKTAGVPGRRRRAADVPTLLLHF